MATIYRCKDNFSINIFDADDINNIQTVIVPKDSDWLFSKRLNKETIVLTNNYMELIVDNQFLKNNFTIVRR